MKANRLGLLRNLDLVGQAEIAERVGKTRAAVDNDIRRHTATFPKPVFILAAGRFYDWAEVTRWYQNRSSS